MKVLCFTTSYLRYKMLRGCIRDIQNQTYRNLVHGVNVALDEEKTDNGLNAIFDDLYSDNLFMAYSINEYNHWNHITAIKTVPNYMDYDIFVKIDDDDMYKKDYVQTIVDTFKDNPEADIVSSKCMYYLKDTQMIVNKKLFNNFGGNPEGTDYNMPFTFAFNKKALESILSMKRSQMPSKAVHGHDRVWRYKWEEDGLKHIRVFNEGNFVWYVHGRNISTSDFLKR